MRRGSFGIPRRTPRWCSIPKEGTIPIKRAATLSLQDEWPFTVELTPLSDLIIDNRYQRPPQDAFVDKIANSFDDTLVGVLDVSERKNGSHAVLDGLQRFTAMKKVGKNGCYCAVYTGMSLADEAMFFYRKNKDRRSVHPFYSFRARMVAGDKDARDINRIVESWEFKLHPNAREDNNIAAVAAVEEAYSWESAARTNSLEPALKAIRYSFATRPGAKEGDMIRGLGRLFQPFYDEEVDWQRMYDVLESLGPRNIIGRARDALSMSPTATRLSVGDQIARDILKIYNRGIRVGKLNPQMLHKRK